MKQPQIHARKTLMSLMAALFVLLVGTESAFACHQDPCPTYCEGKWCR